MRILHYGTIRPDPDEQGVATTVGSGAMREQHKAAQFCRQQARVSADTVHIFLVDVCMCRGWEPFQRLVNPNCRFPRQKDEGLHLVGQAIDGEQNARLSVGHLTPPVGWIDLYQVNEWFVNPVGA